MGACVNRKQRVDCLVVTDETRISKGQMATANTQSDSKHSTCVIVPKWESCVNCFNLTRIFWNMSFQSHGTDYFANTVQKCKEKAMFPKIFIRTHSWISSASNSKFNVMCRLSCFYSVYLKYIWFKRLKLKAILSNPNLCRLYMLAKVRYWSSVSLHGVWCVCTNMWGLF